MCETPFAREAHCWQLRNTTLQLASTPLLMGIVNVTPDSFSDGGRFFQPEAAVEQALALVEEGADILDIGGESTRPYSHAVDVEEELRRVIPVVRALCRQTTVPVSVDTSKAVVAKEALECGAEIINDVTGLEGDDAMLPLARQSGAGVCVMHMQGTPATMQDHPSYSDVVVEVGRYLCRRRDRLHDAGIDPPRICLDPGVGFGKTHQHNLTLLAQCYRFRSLGCPILVGHSRKGFIAHVLGDKETDRLAGTIGASLSLAFQGVHILRIHDVRAVGEAIRLFAATGGCRRRPPLTPAGDFRILPAD